MSGSSANPAGFDCTTSPSSSSTTWAIVRKSAGPPPPNPPLFPPPPNPPLHLPDLAAGLRPLANTPVLILGVQSDILFPVEQQREVADALRIAGNQMVSYYELGGVWGHDTFL